MAKLVDALDLGSSAARCESSSLSFRTIQGLQYSILHYLNAEVYFMAGLLILLIFLLSGTVLQQALNLPLPASILGMLMLLSYLLIRGKTPTSLIQISTALSPLLPLFIIPVSVGIVTQKSLLAEHGLILFLFLAISIIPGALVSAWIMKGGKSDL